MIQLNISISSDDTHFEEVVSALRAPRNEPMAYGPPPWERDMDRMHENFHKHISGIWEAVNKIESMFKEILDQGDPPEGPHEAKPETAQDVPDENPRGNR